MRLREGRGFPWRSCSENERERERERERTRERINLKA